MIGSAFPNAGSVNVYDVDDGFPQIMTFLSLGRGCNFHGTNDSDPLDAVRFLPFFFSFSITSKLLFSYRYGGLFVNLSSIGWWFRWISYISVFQWGFEGNVEVDSAI